MAWECPACSEINEADDLIKCICGFELTGDPKGISVGRAWAILRDYRAIAG